MASGLNPDEQVLREAKISVAAVAVLWLSVPAFLLVGFCGTYLPGLIGAYASSETMQALLDGIGAETASFHAVFSAVKENLFGGVPKPVVGFAIALVVLLVVCWLSWACVCTKLHFRYSLLVTDSRVIGSAGKQTLDAPLCELKNVFVGQSWMGKLFRYGTVTVQTERSSLTVKNVSRPNEIKALLAAYL